ncbi:2-amino-4-hydroxy-6-hydroxymethyldihydropteridine diphosphokinase [Acidihalobacter prosperus]
MSNLKPDMRGYIIGIGSNIAPESNIPRILDELLHRFKCVHISRILRTSPIGIRSKRLFLNLAVLIETDIEPTALKDICNEIESILGRDREDPDRACKDREADLDILFALGEERLPKSLDWVEGSYFRPVVADIYSLLGLSGMPNQPRGVSVSWCDVSAGEVPATIYRDGSSGNIIVIQYKP